MLRAFYIFKISKLQFTAIETLVKVVWVPERAYRFSNARLKTSQGPN